MAILWWKDEQHLDARYAMGGYLFGTQPNAFLLSQQTLQKRGAYCLAVADGEGRNGVWLAEQGLRGLCCKK
ncbi:MAG: hypothetical protein H0U72_13810 [Nitrosospira sp.]|nr:hypothetical protein [Nitrosospira sp.]